MNIKSGKRKQLRLELDRDIFKTFELIGDKLEDSKIFDICHYGMGIVFQSNINKLSVDELITFSIKFDDKIVDIEGIVRHAGSKFSGIEFKKILTNKQIFYDYIDSRIIKKFKIPSKNSLRGLLIQKVDVKIIIILLILEVFLILGGIYLYNLFKEKDDSFKYLRGEKIIKSIT